MLLCTLEKYFWKVLTMVVCTTGSFTKNIITFVNNIFFKSQPKTNCSAFKFVLSALDATNGSYANGNNPEYEHTQLKSK